MKSNRQKGQKQSLNRQDAKSAKKSEKYNNYPQKVKNA